MALIPLSSIQRSAFTGCCADHPECTCFKAQLEQNCFNCTRKILKGHGYFTRDGRGRKRASAAQSHCRAAVPGAAYIWCAADMCSKGIPRGFLYARCFCCNYRPYRILDTAGQSRGGNRQEPRASHFMSSANAPRQAEIFSKAMLEVIQDYVECEFNLSRLFML